MGDQGQSPWPSAEPHPERTGCHHHHIASTCRYLQAPCAPEKAPEQPWSRLCKTIWQVSHREFARGHQVQLSRSFTSDLSIICCGKGFVPYRGRYAERQCATLEKGAHCQQRTNCDDNHSQNSCDTPLTAGLVWSTMAVHILRSVHPFMDEQPAFFLDAHAVNNAASCKTQKPLRAKFTPVTLSPSTLANNLLALDAGRAKTQHRA